MSTAVDGALRDLERLSFVWLFSMLLRQLMSTASQAVLCVFQNQINLVEAADAVNWQHVRGVRRAALCRLCQAPQRKHAAVFLH